MCIMDTRTPAVNERIARYRAREREADARMARVVAATQHYGRLSYGDEDATPYTGRSALAFAMILLGIVILAAIIFTAIYIRQGSNWV